MSPRSPTLKRLIDVPRVVPGPPAPVELLNPGRDGAPEPGQARSLVPVDDEGLRHGPLPEGGVSGLSDVGRHSKPVTEPGSERKITHRPDEPLVLILHVLRADRCQFTAGRARDAHSHQAVGTLQSPGSTPVHPPDRKLVHLVVHILIIVHPIFRPSTVSSTTEGNTNLSPFPSWSLVDLGSGQTYAT